MIEGGVGCFGFLWGRGLTLMISPDKRQNREKKPPKKNKILTGRLGLGSAATVSASVVKRSGREGPPTTTTTTGPTETVTKSACPLDAT